MKKTTINFNSFFNAITVNRKATMAGKLLLAFLITFTFSGCQFMDDMDEIKKGKDKPPKDEAKLFLAELHPLNNSGVEGKVTFKYQEGREFLAEVRANGLVPNMVHPQHIHGFGFEGHIKHAVCPPESAAGDDGLLTLEDGLPFYGPVLIPLDNELYPVSAQDFPMANANGQLNYFEFTELNSLLMSIDETYEGKQTLENLALRKRVVVIHGAFVKDGQIVSPDTEGAEYNATLPVACGKIEEVGGHHDDH